MVNFFRRSLVRLIPFDALSIFWGPIWHDRWTKTQCLRIFHHRAKMPLFIRLENNFMLTHLHVYLIRVSHEHQSARHLAFPPLVMHR